MCLLEILFVWIALASLTAAGTLAYEVLLQGLPASIEAVIIAVMAPLFLGAVYAKIWLEDVGGARVKTLLGTDAGKAALRDWKAMMALCLRHEEDCDDLLVQYRLWGHVVFPRQHRGLLGKRPAMRRLFIAHFSRHLGWSNTVLLLTFGPLVSPAASSNHERLRLSEAYPEMLEISRETATGVAV